MFLLDATRRQEANLAADRWRVHLTAEASEVIKTRRLQRSFGDGLIAAEEAIFSMVSHALLHRHPNSCRRGRQGFPAEVVVRLLILKHLRNWSYKELEREVRAGRRQVAIIPNRKKGLN